MGIFFDCAYFFTSPFGPCIALLVCWKFFSYTANKKFKDWWDVSMVAQSVLILYGVILCSISVIFSTKIIIVRRKNIRDGFIS